MSIVTYKADMRLNRGRLTKFDDQMEFIYNSGSTIFREHMLNNKYIGLDKACDIISKLNHSEQSTLIDYIKNTVPRPRIADIDLKVIRIISDR